MGILSDPNDRFWMGANILAHKDIARGLLGFQQGQFAQQKYDMEQLRFQQQQAEWEAKRRAQALQADAAQRMQAALNAGDRQSALQAAMDIPGLQATALAAMNKTQSYAPVKVMKDGVPTWVSREEAYGMPAAVSNGMSFSTNPDGTVSFSQGGYGDMGKPTRNNIEEKQFNAMEQLSRIKGISQSYQPRFQQYQDRFGLTWDSLKDSFGADLSQSEKAELSDFSIHKRRATENLNATIKEITGAAMTIGEAERIKSQVPNAGTGIFDGDSPTVFKSKLDDTERSLKNAIRRYQYARMKGLDWKTLSLTGMDKLIQKRGEELAGKYMEQGLDEKTATQKALADLKQEFGL